MHTPAILVATVAILSTVASAEPDRPKFYFPRHIKRPITYANETLLPLKKSSQELASTKRSLTDFLNGGTTGDGRQSFAAAGTTGNLLDSLIAPLLATSQSTDSAAASSSDVGATSITVQPTSTVPSTDASTTSAPTPTSLDSTPSDSDLLDSLIGSTGLLPSIIVLPTTSAASSSVSQETAAPSTTGGITFGPGGVSSSSSDDSAATASDASSDGVTSSETAGSAASTSAPTSSDSPGLIPFLSSLFSQATSDSTPTSTSGTSTSTDPATSAAAATSDSLAATTSAPGTSDLLSSLVASVTDLFPTVSSSDVSPTSTSGVTGPATTGAVVPTSSDASVPTTTSGSTGLGSILSSILDPSPSDASTLSSTGSVPVTLTPTDSSLASSTLTPSGTGLVTGTGPLTTPTVLPTSGNSTEVISPPLTTSSGSAFSTATDPVTTIPTDAPTGTANGTASATASSILPPTDTSVPANVTSPTGTSILGPTTLPTANGTETAASASLPTVVATTPSNGTEVVAPTSAPSFTSAPVITSAPVVTSAPGSITAGPTETAPPTVIIPTGTDSGTSMWLPQTIIIASSASLVPGAAPTSDSGGIPSSLPQVISAPNSTVETPKGMTLVQVGFEFPLNWKFVAEHAISAAQIFQYLPVGLSQGLNLQEDQVTMHSLIPLDTSRQVGYVTTLALAYIPANMLNTLALDLHIPTAPIYTNADPSVAQLMNYIDPAVPLQPGTSLDSGSATGTGGGSSATGNAGGNSGVFNTEAQNTSPAVRSTTAGIAVGCVGAAAAYGAAMFSIARRYKRRKQGHRRASSIMSNSEMRQSGSPALLGGANPFMAGGRTSPSGSANNDRHSRGSGRSAGNSARTQQISAPMMAENSLGWN